MRKLVLACALLFIILAPLKAPWLQFVFTMAVANGLAALGVVILLRSGLISIGHAMFFAISAYSVAFLTQSGITDFGTVAVAAILITGVLGAIIGLFLIRYRAIFFAMLSLAVSMVVYTLFAKLYGLTGGTDGMTVLIPRLFGRTLTEPAFKATLFYLSITLMVIAGFAIHRYLNSPLGHALNAVEANEVRLEYLGVPTWVILLIAFTVSSMLAAMGGVIGAFAIGRAVPDFSFWTASAHLVLIAVLGGIGGVPGAFIGAFFLEILHTWAASFTDAWNLIVGVTLIGVMMFLPHGLYGLLIRREAVEK
ncbi:Branched-chain amino acid transport system permease protein OS=Castellaniella defragrans OX=75697 GN=HNR28_003467 PE=4 SV=1 [Castellaniella defragrans]